VRLEKKRKLCGIKEEFHVTEASFQEHPRGLNESPKKGIICGDPEKKLTSRVLLMKKAKA